MKPNPRVRPGPKKASEPPPSRAAGALLGAALGAGVASALCGAEWAVTGWIGLGAPAGEVAVRVATLAVLTGALVGGLAGLGGLRGGAWALATTGALGGWLTSGRVGAMLAEAGGDALAGPFVTVALGLGAAMVAATALFTEGKRLGGAAAAGLWLTVALPINQHLIGAPTSSFALSVDLLVLLGAAVVGVFTGLVFGGARAVIPLVVVANLVAWAAAWPKLGPPQVRWPEPGVAEGPPIVMILVDTLRADRLGFAGYERPTSPTLDAMARSGVIFELAHATAPWTLPSTASLFTGQLPSHHGAGLHDGTVNQRSALRAEVPTLAERLRAKGYATAGVVSNPWTSATYGFHRGFSVWDDATGEAPLPGFVHPLHVLGIDPVGWPVYRDAAEITDAGLAFLADRPPKGWFLFLQYMDVHGPLRPTEADVAAVGGGEGLPDRYDAAIHQVDREIARLLRALPESAVVVLTSDHGEELRENRPYRAYVPEGTRHGHHLHQELIHVPLVFAGGALRPQRVRRPVSLVDVAPTLLRLAGAEPLGDTHGVPLPEIVGGKSNAAPIRAEAIRYGGEQQAVRMGAMKLIRDTAGTELLFDLSADPAEARAFSPADRVFNTTVPDLRALLPAPGGGEAGSSPAIGAELRVLLERLGYVAEPTKIPVEAP